MIDDSDGDYILLSYNGKGGLFGAVVVLIIAAIVYVIAAQNREDCAKRHCGPGLQPKVVSHECVGSPAEGTQ